jgi:NAD-dependent dihydropyrimidine dehydrogenase PreA subunit
MKAIVVDQIREMAEEGQIPVLGFDPTSEMACERPDHRPEDLLPGARRLICFGLPVPRGVYRTPGYTLETVWRPQNLSCHRLDTQSMWVAALREENGARAGRYPEIDEPDCPLGCCTCADACPVEAILIEERRVRIMSCLGHTAHKPQMLRFFLLSKLRPGSAAQYVSIRPFDEHTFHVCSECAALYPSGEGEF